MFVRNRCRLMLLALLSPGLALLSPSAAMALGLGDIHLKSSLDAPLSADIDVVDANADDLSTLKATLASRDTFTHLGAQYPTSLGTVTFTPQKTADGRIVLHVSSTGIADEPIATLLVEADWSRGHVVREYTVLLNPPLFNSQTATQAAVSAPTVDSGASSGAIEHPAPSSSATAGSPPSAAPNSAAANGSAGSGAEGAGAASSGAEANNGAEPSNGAEANNGAPASNGVQASNGAAAGAQGSSPGNGARGAAGNAGGSSAGGPAGGSSYTVQRGDTLSTIAATAYGAHTRRARDQALVAIYRANPNAFVRKNMNELRAGAVISLPGDSELQAIGPGEAATEVRHQYDDWRGARGLTADAGGAGAAATSGGQLRLVAPQQAAQEAGSQGQQSQTNSSAGSGPGAGGNGAGGQNNAALQARVQQLQQQLAESQRLLQLRDAQLAAMQAQIAQQNKSGGAAAAAAASAAAAPAAAAPAPGAGVPAGAAPAPAPTGAVPPAAHPTAPVVRPHPPVAHRVPARAAAHPAQPGNSMLDLVLEYWYVPAALLVILIALLVLKAVRNRQEDAFDRSLGRLSTPALEPEEPARPRADTMPVRTMAQRPEASYSVEESGTHQQPVFDESVALPPDDAGEPAGQRGQHGQQVAVDEGIAGEVPVALDQGDPLAEADFHMAYGLYDQAAELVQNAIAREPQRRDLKLKLLEVFFVWGNRDRFLESAHELAATRNQAAAGEWEKIVIMGRQIAPEDPLFADGRAVSGAASAGVDLDLEGGQNRVDFDLLGEPSLGKSKDSSVDLDLGTADQHPAQHAVGAGDADPTSEAVNLNSSVDFVVEGDLDTAATGSTHKMPSVSGSATTREMPAMPAAARGMGDTERVAVASAATAEAPTVEQPQLPRDPGATIRQKIDAAMRHGSGATDETAELAIDDLGLDLGSLETHEEARAVANSSEAPTMLAEMHPEALQRMVRADAERAEAGAVQSRAAPGATMRATGTWMFTDTDFASVAPVKAAASVDATQQAKTEMIAQIAAQPPMDTSSTSRLATLDSADLDLDLSGLEGLGEQHANGLDLDVGEAAGDGTQVKTRKLPAAQLAGGIVPGEIAAQPTGDESGLPDLEPVTLSEVGTKLDLARAYMDMGDPEGARSILSEVLSEGSLSQKQEARRLMDALPG